MIGVDASRNRSGGAQLHLKRILSYFVPSEFGIKAVHVWADRQLLDQLPDQPWLVKHDANPRSSNLIGQLIWQATRLSEELKTHGCQILFSTDASTLCTFKPMVVLSQDLLSYEPGIIQCFGYGFRRLRLIAILIAQNLAFRRADACIFLTRYSAELIQRSCGRLRSFRCIPHGVDDVYRDSTPIAAWPTTDGDSIKCIYVSNAEMYKLQWKVVEAVSLLRESGYNISLLLVGGGSGPAQRRLRKSMLKFDPKEEYVHQTQFLSQFALISHLEQSNIFIFASQCEAFGITMLEGMALGLPIACSNRSSLPEILQDGGIYFDPMDSKSIVDAIQILISSPSVRQSLACRAKELSRQYTWGRCANDTWSYIVDTYNGSQR